MGARRLPLPSPLRNAASTLRAVPFDESNLGPVVLKRLEERVPTVWALLSEFREKSQKLKK